MKTILFNLLKAVLFMLLAVLLFSTLFSCSPQPLEVENQEQITIYKDNPSEYLYSDLSDMTNLVQWHENGELYEFTIDAGKVSIKLPEYAKSVKIPHGDLLEINPKNVVDFDFGNEEHLTFRVEI